MNFFGFMDLSVVLTTFNNTIPKGMIEKSVMKCSTELIENYMGTTWIIDVANENIKNNSDAIDLCVKFNLQKGNLPNGNVGVKFEFNDWSTMNYVLIPGAAYNGNRFKSIKFTYPPMLTDEKEIGVNIETIITDVPRLNIGDGVSRIQLLSGDMTTPSVAFFDKNKKKGFIMLTEHITGLGYSGISIEENDGRNKAYITVSAPGVRYATKYTNNNNQAPCDDIPHNFSEGESIDLHFKIYYFDCNNIRELFDYFFVVRKDLNKITDIKNTIPFSTAMKNIEEKHNSEHWDNEYKLYKITSGDSVHGYWQAGWVGGGINTYPLLMDGEVQSRTRAYQTLNSIFNEYQMETGFFYATAIKDIKMGDNHEDHGDTSWSLIRKQTDLAYFLLRQFILIDKKKFEKPVPEKWILSTRKLLDALVRIWDKYGQFGQFIDIHKEKIIVGGTASAGIAPGALALGSKYFDDERYLKVAKDSGEYFYDNFISNGITNGGPGEIVQCPDSESAFALLESYVMLFEITQEKCWIKMAEDTAKQCATWCVSYNFKFPEKSEFARLGINTLGSVYANVQNKHSAPGICTLSGFSLFALYRITGNRLYLELIKDIAHNITQYLSTRERPVKNYNGEIRPAGYMCERVNMCDWEGKQMVGMVFLSTWPEISCMLTFSDIPGIYIQKDTGFVFSIDNIDVKIIEISDEKINLQINNSTEFDADVKIFTESANNSINPLSEIASIDFDRVLIPPNDFKEVVISRV